MYIKAIADFDEWSSEEIEGLKHGGNTRFDEFISPYLVNLDMTKTIVDVFRLQAAEYYRKRLHAYIHSLQFDESPPSLEVGTRFIAPPEIVDRDHELFEEDVLNDGKQSFQLSMQYLDKIDRLDGYKNERLVKIDDGDADIDSKKKYILNF